MSNDLDFDLRWNDGATDRMSREVEARVTQAGYHLQEAIVTRLQAGGHSGKTYSVPGTKGAKGGTKVRHVSSAPGESPATLYGWLANNVLSKPVLEWDGPVSYVGIRGGADGVPYAKRLEYGFTGRDSKGRQYNQAPRPYFRSTYEQEMENIKRLLGGR